MASFFLTIQFSEKNTYFKYLINVVYLVRLSMIPRYVPNKH